MDNKPLVTIITICFNSSETILETINSVNNQSYNFIEHVFIDGASTDRTLEIIKNASKKAVTVISEKDNGIYNAMNKGLKFAKGEIVGFLNSDDKLQDIETINNIVAEFNSDIDCVYGDLVFTNSKKEIVRKWKSSKFKSGLFKYSWTPAHPTFYCRRSVYDKFGGYREDFSIAADVDLMFRFLEIYKIKSSYLNQIIVEMKMGGVSTQSLNSTFILSKEVFNSFKTNNYRYSKIAYWIGKFYKALKQLL